MDESWLDVFDNTRRLQTSVRQAACCLSLAYHSIPLTQVSLFMGVNCVC
jgi:hypothetical protein